MKYLPLIWASLWRKPLRTTLTTLALVAAFVLFGLLEGINAGFYMLREAARNDGLHVEMRYGAPLPLAYRDQIAGIPGVKSVVAVAAMGGMVNGDPKKRTGVGFAEDGYYDYLRVLDVSPAQKAALRANRAGIIVGKAQADRLGIKTGDRITITSPLAQRNGSKDWVLDVVAVVDRKDIPNASGSIGGNFEYLNEERATGRDLIDDLVVVVNDPDYAVAIAKTIDDRFLNSSAPTRTTVDRLDRDQEYDDDTTHVMVNAVVLSSLFALLLMTSSVMMQCFRERIPEFGVLKAMGFSDRGVLGLVLGEAVIQCLTGAVAGLGIAHVLVPYTKKLLTGRYIPFMYVSWTVIAAGLAIACLVAIVSSGLPAWRAGRMQVVDALAGR